MDNPRTNPMDLEQRAREAVSRIEVRLARMALEHERFGASFEFEKRLCPIEVADVHAILLALSPPDDGFARGVEAAASEIEGMDSVGFNRTEAAAAIRALSPSQSEELEKLREALTNLLDIADADTAAESALAEEERKG